MLLCALYPALRATRRNLSGSLALASRTQVSVRSGLQWVLVGVQVALAVTLLAGAGLLLRSFQELGRVSPGFDPTHVLTLHITGGWGETADMKALTQRIDRTLDLLRRVPGVEGAATSGSVPGVPGQYQTQLKLAEAGREPDRKIMVDDRFVSPGYFTTMRIPLLAGDACHNTSGPLHALVNRSFVKAYLAGETVIGRQLLPQDSAFLPSGEIRGEVEDAREEGIDHAPVPTVYWCISAPDPDPMAMTETLRRKIHEIEPGRSVFDIMPLEEHLGDAFADSRLRTVLLTFFAVTAVSLACLGLYGTLSYFVTVRKREIGLRLALGAMRSQIGKHFLLQGLGVSFGGCIAGLGLAAASARLLAGMLYGVSPSDAATWSGVVLIVLAVAAAASLLPALRAARVEPMQVLRDE